MSQVAWNLDLSRGYVLEVAEGVGVGVSAIIGSAGGEKVRRKSWLGVNYLDGDKNMGGYDIRRVWGRDCIRVCWCKDEFDAAMRLKALTHSVKKFGVAASEQTTPWMVAFHDELGMHLLPAHRDGLDNRW